jgi:hypothetical protein
MSSARRFIKLGNCLVNINAIRRVWFDTNAFQIELNPSGTTGFMFMGSGSFEGDVDNIKVCKEKHPESYKEMEKWFLENSNTM